ncbi:MAG: PAS domain-containing protein [Deltaproteobacteria bacterium]
MSIKRDLVEHLGIYSVVALIFMLDTQTPRGYSPWILYGIPLFPASRPDSRINIRILYLVCALLTIAGFFLERPGLPPAMSIFDRAAGLLVGGIIFSLSERNKAQIKERNVEIAERKRLEETLREREDALRDSQEKLKQILDTIPVSVFWKDRNSTFLGCNRRFAEKAGVRSPEELIGKNDFDLVWKDQAPLYRADDRRVIESGVPKINYEEPQTSPSGRTIWLQTSKIPLRNAKGEITGVMGTFEDITPRKQAEEAVKNSMQLFRSVLSNMYGSILYVNNESRVEFANQDFCNNFHLKQTPEDLEGCTSDQIMEMIRPSYAGGERAIEHAREIVREGKAIKGEEVHMSDGRTTLRDFVPIKIGGKPAGRLWYQIDVTRLKQAEEIVRRDKEIVEKLVSQRTEELIEAHQELERSKRLSDIGQLAATVAHELRNPLAAIDMASVNIRRKANIPDLKRHLETIHKKVFESDQIINNLLFYSRLRSPHIESTNIYGLLTDSIRAAKARMPETVSVELDADPVKQTYAEVDPIQIKEVFVNIFNNAVDAVSHKPGGRITITARRPDGDIQITFNDNGVGMDKETLAKAMEPFYSTKAKGTGLGLSVSRQIVDLHHGQIKLGSEPGKGTMVTVCLPLHRSGPG